MASEVVLRNLDTSDSEDSEPGHFSLRLLDLYSPYLLFPVDHFDVWLCIQSFRWIHHSQSIQDVLIKLKRCSISPILELPSTQAAH